MAYKMYLDGVLMPITPSKVTVKINNQNKTMTLINGEEINILKAAALSDVSFELLLPQVSYPFTNGGAQSASYYISLFERLKNSKEPFQWILNRQPQHQKKSLVRRFFGSILFDLLNISGFDIHHGFLLYRNTRFLGSPPFSPVHAVPPFWLVCPEVQGV